MANPFQARVFTTSRLLSSRPSSILNSSSTSPRCRCLHTLYQRSASQTYSQNDLQHRRMQIKPPSTKYSPYGNHGSRRWYTRTQDPRDLYRDPRRVMRDYPVAFPAMLFLILGMSAFGVFGLWAAFYMRWENRNFPEEVDMQIRRAKYFTTMDPDQPRAVRAWVKAFKLAVEHNMHPLSEEVITMWFAMVQTMEAFGGHSEAAKSLEMLKQDILDYMEKECSVEKDPAERRRLLEKAVKLSVQIGSLYAHRNVAEPQKAEDCLVYAVETTLKEQARRQEEGVKEGEGEWMDNDQIGATFQALAHQYEEKNQHYFAGQLFLRALTLKTEQDCETVLLMNSLAACIAQQIVPPRPGEPPPSREQLRASARVWAQRSLELARHIKPPKRTQECDIGCVVATHNLGEFAEMDGNIEEARDRYEEAGSLAHAMNFKEGLNNADEGLRRLNVSKTNKKSSWWDNPKIQK